MHENLATEVSLTVQVGPSLLTASLADVLKLPDSSPAINASCYLPLHLSRTVPESEAQQEGKARVQTTAVSPTAPAGAAAVHEVPRTKKKKRQRQQKGKSLFPSLQQTGIGIRSEDFKDVRDQLNKKLSWSRKATPMLTKAFQVVEVGGPAHPTMQLLPPVAQVAPHLSPFRAMGLCLVYNKYQTHEPFSAAYLCTSS